ncbi:unnamed protein product, partial [Staurois parvus]
MTAGTGSSGIGLSGSTAGIGSPGMTAGTGSSGVIGSSGWISSSGWVQTSGWVGTSGWCGCRGTRLNHGRQVLRRQAHRFGYWQDGTGWEEFSLFSGFSYR